MYPGTANPRAGKISVLSPMGTALLGAREGDVLSVLGAQGPRAIAIQSILHQPEAAGGVNLRADFVAGACDAFGLC